MEGSSTKMSFLRKKADFLFFSLNTTHDSKGKIQCLTELVGESSKDNKCQVKVDVFAGMSFKQCLKDNPSKMGISTWFSSSPSWGKKVLSLY